MGKIWSKEEKELLKTVYSDGSKEYILGLFPDRNWQAITIKANRLKVHRLNYFTESELNFIKENYKEINSKRISEILGRDRQVVDNKMIEMGIVRQENWTEDDITILKNSFGKYSVQEISESILKNRTKSSIYHACQALGLSDETKKHTKEELLESLWNLSQELGRTPVSLELPIYGLACNSVYVRFFGGYGIACEILGLDLNETIFKQTKIYDSKNKDKCRSKSEQIITNYLIDHGIEYIMDKKYSTVCAIGEFGKKRFDWLLSGKVIVEYFGLNRNKKYQERMKQKIYLCELNGLRLIQIFDKDIFKLDNIFGEFL